MSDEQQDIRQLHRALAVYQEVIMPLLTGAAEHLPSLKEALQYAEMFLGEPSQIDIPRDVIDDARDMLMHIKEMLVSHD